MGRGRGLSVGLCMGIADAASANVGILAGEACLKPMGLRLRDLPGGRKVLPEETSCLESKAFLIRVQSSSSASGGQRSGGKLMRPEGRRGAGGVSAAAAAGCAQVDAAAAEPVAGAANRGAAPS